MTDMGALNLDCSAVGGDGSVATGRFTDTNHITHLIRWTSASGTESLAPPTGESYSYGTGVNHDGTVLVGTHNLSWPRLAFRWTRERGKQSLPLPTGHSTSEGFAVSRDGSVIVGDATSSSGVTQACRWTNAGTSSPGITMLGVPPGAAASIAYAVSADGSVVAGSSLSGGVYTAFRWTNPIGGGGGLVSLGTLPGRVGSEANGVSGNGAVVVGLAGDSSMGFTRAFMWNASLGMVDLNAYLPSIGVNLTGWLLRNATAISADGRTIVGEGAHNGVGEAWLATIPPPATCFTVDGIVGARGCVSTTSTLSINPVGGGPFAYRWRFNGAAIEPAVNTSAATAVLVIGHFGVPNAGEYDCVVSNACGSVTSNTARLSICVADFDDGNATGMCDGGVTIEDLFYYLTIYEAGVVRADVDDGSATGTPDGGVGIEDLLYYLQRYDAGC